MRGEKLIAVHQMIFAAGSPPHARGKGIGRALLQHNGRITPACAGKRALAPFPARLWQDHPRMRGEKT